MLHSSSQRTGVAEFEILSFVDNAAAGSKLFDVIQKRTSRSYTMEATPRLQKNRSVDTKLRKHSKIPVPFLVQLHYSFSTSARNYFILTHTNKQLSLIALLKHKKNLTEAEITFIIAELIVAVEKLHQQDVVYGGVEKADIFFDRHGHVLLRRVYSGKSYWSKDECCSCDESACAHHVYKPSNADKTVDWTSVIQLYAILSEGEAIKLTSNARNFVKLVTSKNYTVSTIKSHPLFSGMNWTEVYTKTLAVPLEFTLFVKGSPKVQSVRRMGNVPTHNFFKHNKGYVSQQSLQVTRGRSMTYCPIADSKIIVGGIRKHRSIISEYMTDNNRMGGRSLSERTYSQTLFVPTSKLNGTRNSRQTDDHINKASNDKLLQVKKTEQSRKTSIEHYRKRLEEISKVLENQKNMIQTSNSACGSSQSENNSFIVTSTSNTNNFERNAKLEEKKLFQNEIVKKIYSENECIRKILSKYGLLKEEDLFISCENDQQNNLVANQMEKTTCTDLTSETFRNNIKNEREETLRNVKSCESFLPEKNSNKYTDMQEEQIDGNNNTNNDDDNNNNNNNNSINNNNKTSVECNHHFVDQNNNVKEYLEEMNNTMELLSKLEDLSTRIQLVRRTERKLSVRRHASDITPTSFQRLSAYPDKMKQRGNTVLVQLKRSRTTTERDTMQSGKSISRRNEQNVPNSPDSGLHDVDHMNVDSEDDDVFVDSYAAQQQSNIHRTDSGIALLDKSSDNRLGKLTKPDHDFVVDEEVGLCCNDCGRENNNSNENSEYKHVCKKCQKSRLERKEAILELIQTEINYGYDLRVIKEEFYIPMKKNSICTQDELTKLFSNLQELVDVNSKLCSALHYGLECCIDQEDKDFKQLTVGKIFLNSVELFEAYETFCSKQQEMAGILETLQKKSEVVRIFLNVSSKENYKLRKMDLKAFLTMPIQRIMKYPLLLNRIYKNTAKSEDRHVIKLALNKLENQICSINHVSRNESFSNPSLKKRSSLSVQQVDVNNLTRLNKFVSSLLDWKIEETSVILQQEFNITHECLVGLEQWKEKFSKKSALVNVLLCVHGPSEDFQGAAESVFDMKNIKDDAKEAVIVLLKRKSDEKFIVYGEPLKLNECVVSINPNIQMKFEISERDKAPLIFSASSEDIYKTWMDNIHFVLNSLQIKWRQRRGGMSNIMISTMF